MNHEPLENKDHSLHSLYNAHRYIIPKAYKIIYPQKLPKEIKVIYTKIKTVCWIHCL